VRFVPEPDGLGTSSVVLSDSAGAGDFAFLDLGLVDEDGGLDLAVDLGFD